MVKLARWLIFMTLVHTSLAGSITSIGIYLLDITGNLNTPLNEQGGQPAGVAIALTIVGDDLQAGDTIALSCDMSVFTVPAGAFSVTVNSGGSGKNCLLTYSSGGTAKGLNFALSPLNGQCFLPRGVKFNFTLPQSVVAPNPVFADNVANPRSTWSVQASGDRQSVRVNYADAAIIYAIADPRTADDSASFLGGGGTPGGMRVGFTPTVDLVADDLITIQSNKLIFRRMNDISGYTVRIGNTGCTGKPKPGSGATSSIQLTLQGTSCKLAANVAVNPSDLLLPSIAMAPLPLSSVVTVTITAAKGDVVYNNANLNPTSFTTTDGCGEWGEWQACSATCAGTTSRRRASVGGCALTTQTRGCNTIACGCTAWSAWSACGATCGSSATSTRTRTGSNRNTCNVPTTETVQCGPPSCNCPYEDTACSSSCGSGVKTRTVKPKSGWGSSCGSTTPYKVVCNDTRTPEAVACNCQDLTVSGVAWKDKRQKTCADYVNNGWCTRDGGYGPNWPTDVRSFEEVANGGQTAVSACCGCGKSRCVKDTVLLIDQSASIADSDWVMIKQYITDRVAQTPFTDQYGNRIGVVGFDVGTDVLCPMTWDQDFLKSCVAGIKFNKGGGTSTAAGLNLAGAMLGNHSSPNRTRVIEMLTDGSPNRPVDDDTAIPLAYNAAWQLKDQGVTILTLGMGTACTPAKPNDCLNREVLDTMASEPTANFALMLDSYEALGSLSLFISTQCKPTTGGFEQQASPQPNPEPSPRPNLSQQCAAKEQQIPSDYLMFPIGCNKPGVASLLQQYQCTELGNGCGSYKCEQHVPPEAISRLQVSCDNAGGF